jgi:hypothetical protein
VNEALVLAAVLRGVTAKTRRREERYLNCRDAEGAKISTKSQLQLVFKSEEFILAFTLAPLASWRFILFTSSRSIFWCEPD